MQVRFVWHSANVAFGPYRFSIFHAASIGHLASDYSSLSGTGTTNLKQIDEAQVFGKDRRDSEISSFRIPYCYCNSLVKCCVRKTPDFYFRTKAERSSNRNSSTCWRSSKAISGMHTDSSSSSDIILFFFSLSCRRQHQVLVLLMTSVSSGFPLLQLWNIALRIVIVQIFSKW
jgi:hypothetical protein